jgi:hypothetical protein
MLGVMRHRPGWFLAIAMMASACATPSRMSAANPQTAASESSGQEYILVLDHLDPNFMANLSAAGVSPLREIGLLFLVRMKGTQPEQVGKIAGVERVMPATSVVIEMQPEIQDLSPDVERLEGIVTQHYPDINAIGAVIPVIRMPDLLKVRGIKRVRPGSAGKSKSGA